MRMGKKRYLVGIDEAGRGPLAGPVAVAVVVTKWKLNLKVRDSKKLSEKKREEWFRWLKEQKKKGRLDFVVSLVGEKIIDEQGIVPAVRTGIRRCLKRLNLDPKSCRILLDGSLSAPKIYEDQETIIRGDETVPIIALASIAAKVKRDRRLTRLAKKHPKYGFEVHKGYGTRAHYAALRRHGLSPLHRRSFLKDFLK
ncbi:MAG: ribonuclease HII [Patescibacteria group bacterium]